MSQLTPAEPFKIIELAGHRYKVRTKYNYMFFLYYQSALIRNIKARVLEYIKPQLEDDYIPSAEAVSMESVSEWSKSHSREDPVYFESFFEVACTPLDGAPSVKDILLDIEPDALTEIVGFFASLREKENETAQSASESMKSSPKAGRGRKNGSNKPTPRRTTRPSNIAVS